MKTKIFIAMAGVAVIIVIMIFLMSTYFDIKADRWQRNAIAGDSIQQEYTYRELIRTQHTLMDSVKAMGIRLRKVTGVESIEYHYTSKDTIVLQAKEIIREQNIEPDNNGVYNIPIEHKDSCLTIQGKLLSRDIESIVSLDKIDLKASILKVEHIDRMKNGLFRTKLFGTKYIRLSSQANCGKVSFQDIKIKR